MDKQTTIFHKGNGDGVVPKIHFEENEWGYWIQSFNNHSSVISYIAIYEDKISVKWNDTTYWYEGVNNEKVLATLLLTQSLGKVANYIKKHGIVTAKWAKVNDESVRVPLDA